MSTGFSAIPKEKCMIFYKQVEQNAKEKWHSGLLLAEKGYYPSAIYNELICIEELVKALIMLLDGRGMDFRRVKGIDTLFVNHRINYLLAYGLFIMSFANAELMKFILASRENPDEFMNNMRAFYKNEVKIKWFMLRKFVQLKNEFDWFDKIESMRLESAYCNFEGGFKSPIQIDESTYNKVFKRLEKVKTVGVEMIIFFEADVPEVNGLIKKARKQFIQHKAYTHIGQGLSSIRQSRINPFDHIRSTVFAKSPKWINDKMNIWESLKEVE